MTAVEGRRSPTRVPGGGVAGRLAEALAPFVGGRAAGARHGVGRQPVRAARRATRPARLAAGAPAPAAPPRRARGRAGVRHR